MEVIMKKAIRAGHSRTTKTKVGLKRKYIAPTRLKPRKKI